MKPSVLEGRLIAEGYPRFRARQILEWVYRHGISDYRQCTNLPVQLIEYLENSIPLVADAPVDVRTSTDGTKKYLFPAAAAGSTVEAALIPDGKRSTLCLSTQVGCRRACTFCQTGRQGFHGNLSVSGILNQYHSLPERSAVTNIVYMGMGEPLDNPEAVFESLDALTDPLRYALSPRRITLSTVGIHPALVDFLGRGPVNLAVSLHNPFPDERRRIMPVEGSNPITETIRLIRERRADRDRRITFEYTLFDRFNDTEAHALQTAKLLRGLSTRVNLIRYHQIEKSPLSPSSDEQIERFAEWLRGRGIRTFIRKSRGQDIEAACGMLWTPPRG